MEAGNEEPPPVVAVSPQREIKRAEQTVQGKIVKNRRLTTEDHFQDVRHLDIAPEAPLPFESGDALGIYPIVPRDVVDEMLKYCQLLADDVILIRKRDDAGLTEQPEFPFFGHPIKAVDLFSHYFDIQATATRPLLALLAAFADDEEVNERLTELAAPENIDQFLNYAQREKRSFVEVLAEITGVTVPLDRLLCTLPPMRPRYFSIASSPREPEIALTVAVLQFTTPYKRVRKGLCSSALADSTEGITEFQCFIYKCQMRLPSAEDYEEPQQVPLILIGPGTGIAPLRGLIREAKQRGWKGPVHLFNGCRYEAKDNLYGAEWAELVAESRAVSIAENGKGLASFHCHTAFSRDGPKKRYVQHLLVERPLAKELAQMLVNGRAHIYLCGNSKQMPQDVNTSLASLLEVFGGETVNSEQAARKYLSKMKTAGRYQCDTWSS